MIGSLLKTCLPCTTLTKVSSPEVHLCRFIKHGFVFSFSTAFGFGWLVFTRDSIYAIGRICYRPSVCLSVRPSVRWVYHRKTVEVRIMKFSPYGSPSLYFLRGKFHPEILSGSSRAVASNKGGVGKISSFLYLNVNIPTTVADTAKVTMTNRKSHMGFPLTPRSMTLDDMNCCKVKFSLISRHFSCFGGNNSWTNEDKPVGLLSATELYPIKCTFQRCIDCVDIARRSSARGRQTTMRWQKPVSYTHLTLPTNREV